MMAGFSLPLSTLAGVDAPSFDLLAMPAIPVPELFALATILPSCSLSFGNLVPISLGLPRLITPSAKNSPLLPIGCDMQSSL